MKTGQDIFAKKIADIDLTELWTLQEDDTLQVHVLKPGWKQFVQRHALGSIFPLQPLQPWPRSQQMEL